MKNKLLFQKPQIKPEILLYALFLSALFICVSCSSSRDDEIINESFPEANLVSNGISNAPSESGAFVVRDLSEGMVAITLTNKKLNLTATIGWSDLIPRYCTGDGIPAGLATIQDVSIGEDGLNLVELVQGELPVRVLGEYREFNDYDSWCPIFNEAPLLAEGNAAVISTYNEVTEVRSNWTVEVHGQLMSPEGKIKYFDGRVLFAWQQGKEYNSLLDALVSASVQLH